MDELKKQRAIILPLIPMNSTWFAKTAITTAFLGRIGELELAAGTLALTFANVTGFSILNGLSWAMEPICGQAHGARNRPLLRRTLLMTIVLLLATSFPISLLWLCADRILLLFRQQREMATLAKRYVFFLLPDLPATSFLCPLRAFYSSQGRTLPTMFSSAIALGFHLPLNIFLSKVMGIEGVALAGGLTDFVAAGVLAVHLWREEPASGEGWWEFRWREWLRLLRLSGQCCFSGCLEWWAYSAEIFSLWENYVVVSSVRAMLPLMAAAEVFSFPLGACGGIVRGTTRPWMGMFGVVGFYAVGLPTAFGLGFRAGFGLAGLLMGFLAGTGASAVFLGLLVGRVNWAREARDARKIAIDVVREGTQPSEPPANL